MTVLPAREGTGSTLESSAERMSATLAAGKRAHSSAAAPLTCGVAIEVPSA